MAWHNAMVQGASIPFGKPAIVAIAVGFLQLMSSWIVHGDDRQPPHPMRSGIVSLERPAASSAGATLLIDDCEPFSNVPMMLGPSPARAPRPPAHHALTPSTQAAVTPPIARTVPVVWTEYRGRDRPLRGTGSDWLYMPFDGCTGNDTGDFDLRNPSADETVRGTRYIAIDFVAEGWKMDCRRPTRRAAGVPLFHFPAR
jgi:hypothetical protein